MITEVKSSYLNEKAIEKVTMNKSSHKRSAFTLVEILVAVGIIALLAGISFPVFSRIRENGRKVNCQTNLRQLGVAFQQYRQDNGGRLPFAGSFRLWEPGNGQWVAGVKDRNIGTFGGEPGLVTGESSSGASTTCEADGTCNTANPEKGAIFPYIRSTEVFVCPSNSEGKIKRLSYSMNCAIQGMSDRRVRQPQEIILLIDEDTANDGFFFASNTKDTTRTYVVNPVNSTDALTKKHNGGGNLLFMDGHVKFFSFDSFKLDNSDEGLANKDRMTGFPRFHDKGFGPLGSYVPSGVTNDGCGINVSATPTPTP